MKRISTIVLAIILLITMMFAEYRFIMTHLEPTITEETATGAMVEITFMGNIDLYYAEKK